MKHVKSLGHFLALPAEDALLRVDHLKDFLMNLKDMSGTGVPDGSLLCASQLNGVVDADLRVRHEGCQRDR